MQLALELLLFLVLALALAFVLLVIFGLLLVSNVTEGRHHLFRFLGAGGAAGVFQLLSHTLAKGRII